MRRRTQPELDTVVTIGRMTRTLVVVVGFTVRDAAGRAIHGDVIPILVSGCSPPESRSARDVSAWASWVLDLAPLVEAARRHLEASIDASMAAAREYVRAIAQREREISAGVRSTARLLVQAGLFDRRALNQASAKEQAATSLLDEAESRLHSLDPGATLRVEPRIIAVRSVS